MMNNSRGRYPPGIGGGRGGVNAANPSFQSNRPQQQYVQRNLLQNEQQFHQHQQQQFHQQQQQQWLRRNNFPGADSSDEVEKTVQSEAAIDLSSQDWKARLKKPQADMDNQRCVADEVEQSPYQVSRGVSRNLSGEIKGALGSEISNLSDGGSLENSRTPFSLKSPVHEEMGANLKTMPSDISMASNYSAEVKSLASNYSVEVKNSAESPIIADTSTQKLSFSIPSSFSTPIADPLPAHAHPLPPSSTPSRRARRSPGHRLLRQVSDSQIPGLKSPINYCVSEGRSSFVLSACSDITAGSCDGSSDGWSMRTFSELVASSQIERWSFDSKHLGSSHCNISGSSSRFSSSPSVDLQACGACSKLLTERSSWCSQRISANNELPVVAVLVCGHVYHSECLEIMGVDTDKYDPACPICVVGEKQVSKMSRKALKAEAEVRAKYHKISRNRVVDSYLDDNCEEFDNRKDAKREGKTPKMEASSSTRSSSVKPFLRRHFSLGSKWSRSVTDDGSVWKKGFWARYRKD